MKVKLLILFISFAVVFGCSKKKVESDLKYTLEEFNLIMDTSRATPDKATTSAINFSDYSPGINKVNSRPLIYERLGFYAIEFETEKQAREEAMRLGQYYSRNWLFDKVDGEPILEDLVILKFHAVNPKRTIQRKPISTPKAGHGEHGEGHAAPAPAH